MAAIPRCEPDQRPLLRILHRRSFAVLERQRDRHFSEGRAAGEEMAAGERLVVRQGEVFDAKQMLRVVEVTASDGNRVEDIAAG